MRVIGQTPELVPALVRYVECKCLLGGVTTSQGIQLYSNAGIRWVAIGDRNYGVNCYGGVVGFTYYLPIGG